MDSRENAEVPSVAQEAVMVHTSGDLPVEPVVVKGYDFNKGVCYPELLESFKISGFQATNFGLAVEEINKMVSCVFLNINNNSNIDNYSVFFLLES